MPSIAQLLSTPNDAFAGSHEILGNKRLCFGSLPDTAIQICRKGSIRRDELPDLRFADNGSSYFCFPLRFDETRCQLAFAVSGFDDMWKDLATLNSKDYAAFCKLNMAFVTMEAAIAYKPLRENSYADGTIRSGTIMRCEINVFGPEEAGAELGLALAKAGYFLQDPDYLPPETHYKNPQCLTIPVEAQTQRADDAAIPVVKAKKLGLDFINQREYAELNRNYSLWEAVGSDSSQESFRHRITGARSKKGDDVSGGILADEMGLGKTLMILSAIAGSKERGFDFARSMTSQPNQDGNQTIAVKSTLVIVPSTLLIESWKEEIEMHTEPHLFTMRKYHGSGRSIPLMEMLNLDVVLTTYGTVVAEFKSKRKFLYETLWYRVVLDEAHIIRNSSTVQYRAVSALKSRARWCLTGTPIQNSIDDLGSLVSFLRLPILREPAQFKRHIANNIDSSRQKLPDFENLQLLLSSVALRRNISILSIDRADEVTHFISFSPRERQIYEDLGRTWRQSMEMAVSGHNSKQAHQIVVEALLRMRMFCNNGELEILTRTPRPLEADELMSMQQTVGTTACHFCTLDITTCGRLDDTSTGSYTPCHQLLCGDCSASYLQSITLGQVCSICGAFHSVPAPGTDTSASIGDHFAIPSKIEELFQDLLLHIFESKSVVFSFWKRSLDIVEKMLGVRGLSCLRIDGSLPFGQRKRLLEEFKKAPQGMIMLMTLGTGAVGLNHLSVANRVHILEPQWNPSVEGQAIGRIVRLGQSRKVHVVRYVVKKSIEMNVQNGQMRKLNLAKTGFGSTDAVDVEKRSQMLNHILCPEDDD